MSRMAAARRPLDYAVGDRTIDHIPSDENPRSPTSILPQYPYYGERYKTPGLCPWTDCHFWGVSHQTEVKIATGPIISFQPSLFIHSILLPLLNPTLRC